MVRPSPERKLTSERLLPCRGGFPGPEGSLFSIAVILPKPFHGMSTKTQVSGMRFMHADTSAPLL